MTSHEARFEPGQFDPDAPRDATDDARSDEGADGAERAAGAERAERSGGPGRPDGRSRGRAAVGAAGAAIREFVVVVAMALALSFVVKTWLMQAFYIPSGSMEDTLILNDRVVVNKLVPGVVDLQRGDVVVFEDPGDWLTSMPEVSHGPVRDGVERVLSFVGLLPNTSDNHLIKRVIGLPGDTIVCCDSEGRLTVNGVPVTEPYIKPGDVASSITFDITVPEGKVWVMGDHRSDSEDSRFHDPDGTGAQGSVPVANITGRAVAIVWPFDRGGWLSRPESTFTTVPDPSAVPAQPSPSATP
ncbi:signal peptidase I [Knoellia aerolata]|uniref:Signal peptidase I n=1 Tax=Knoellia aerolata DSM 18566 TaxID=1385519 RepID=A0A0A0JWN4_9MICO|nr:signal peptidase I [Knoellia aerolata]KGN40482.1 signal peptidase I [Knoellia aerolata DSM 18566]